MRDFPSYKNAFWGYQRGKPFNAADLDIGKDDAGCFLPTDTEEKFRTELKNTNVFRRIANVIFTESGDKKIKIVPPSGEAAFVGENMAIPEAETGVISYLVKAHKIAKIAKVSTELVRDSGFDLEAAIIADFGREFGRVEESGLINGDGNYKPYGILHSSEGAQTGATATTTLTFDDIKKLYFAVESQYRRNAVWLMNDATALHIRSLKDSAGASVWRDFDDSIFSKPVFTSPYMPDIAAGENPVLFGDFSFFWLLERGGVTFKPLHEIYAAHGITGFIGTEFIDGRLIRREAVKALEVA